MKRFVRALYFTAGLTLLFAAGATPVEQPWNIAAFIIESAILFRLWNNQAFWL